MAKFVKKFNLENLKKYLFFKKNQFFIQEPLEKLQINLIQLIHN